MRTLKYRPDFWDHYEGYNHHLFTRTVRPLGPPISNQVRTLPEHPVAP